MINASLSTTIECADIIIREKFMDGLVEFNITNPYSHGSPVTIANDIDDSSPSLNFTFSDEYDFFKEEDRPDINSIEGCECCNHNMGHNIGCEFSQKCECLEYAAVDTSCLTTAQRKYYNQQLRAKEEDPSVFIDTTKLPKRFPYSKGLLTTYYLNSRNVIYECNHVCKCGDQCKTKVTKKRRQIPVEIFKTANRG
jgi:[histone H3]-lysine9 N-trimethyltransferase SUV39H